MTYITRIANKRILAFIAYKSNITIGNLAPVGRFSPAMPHFSLSICIHFAYTLNQSHSLNLDMTIKIIWFIKIMFCENK